jgi:hypothetical protein
MGKDTVLALARPLHPHPDLVISTEAAHSLIVSRAAEKPASLPKPYPGAFQHPSNLHQVIYPPTLLTLEK